LHGGKIVLSNSIDDLKLIEHKTKSITLEFDEEVNSNKIIDLLKQNNITPSRIETGEACLESLYLEVIASPKGDTK